jgi:hypothetical protein
MAGRAKQILAILEADSVDKLCQNVAAVARKFEVLHRQLAPLAIQFCIARVAEAAAKEKLSL